MYFVLKVPVSTSGISNWGMFSVGKISASDLGEQRLSMDPWCELLYLFRSCLPGLGWDEGQTYLHGRCIPQLRALESNKHPLAENISDFRTGDFWYNFHPFFFLFCSCSAERCLAAVAVQLFVYNQVTILAVWKDMTVTRGWQQEIQLYKTSCRTFCNLTVLSCLTWL